MVLANPLRTHTYTHTVCIYMVLANPRYAILRANQACAQTVRRYGTLSTVRTVFL
jgi:hypothetical protein